MTKPNEKYPIEVALENAINKSSKALVWLVYRFGKWAFPTFRQYKKMNFWVVADHIVFYYIVIRVIMSLWNMWFGY